MLKRNIVLGEKFLVGLTKRLGKYERKIPVEFIRHYHCFVNQNFVNLNRIFVTLTGIFGL